MNNKLNDFIQKKQSADFATNVGRTVHAKLQHVRIGSPNMGDADLIEKIMSGGDELQSFFVDNSQTEVPVAGIVNGHFISRRIDRLVVDDATKTVRVLDYKTDTDTEKFRAKYKSQLHEYMDLLKQIYPKYKISGHILWLHNWTLENI